MPLRSGTELCEFYPQFALDDLRPTDALIVLRRLHGGGQGPRPPGPARSEPFTFEWLAEVGGPGNLACLGGSDAEDLYVRWAWFDKWNLLMVALGPDASDERRGEVLQVLNSMEWVE